MARRLAKVALMPGTVLLAAACLAYGLRRVDLLGLAFAFGIHLTAGWILLLFAPLCLPRATTANAQPRNPFAGP